MQNKAMIDHELSELELAFPDSRVHAIGSDEPWSPVAAVVLPRLALPAGLSEETADLRIPIPDLYGFSTSASVVVLDAPVRETEHENRPVPFCDPIDSSTAEMQAEYFVDVRENADALIGRYSLCVGVTRLPARFHHVPLLDFVRELFNYLSRPTASVEAEIDSNRHALQRNPWDAEAWARVARALAALGRYRDAEELLATCPVPLLSDPWLRSAAERVRSSAAGQP
jgi:Tetratricopeptide repeat